MLEWQPLLNQMSEVQRQVFNAFQQSEEDAALWGNEILQERILAYNDELSTLAMGVGCQRDGRLVNPGILQGLTNQSVQDGESIVNTYNYYLAQNVLGLDVYNYEQMLPLIVTWANGYFAQRNKLINGWTENTARSQAQQDFVSRNANFYSREVPLKLQRAEMYPKTAVCPICKGWISRGSVTLNEAMKDPPPYHLQCPHYWSIEPGFAVVKNECPNLWMGE